MPKEDPAERSRIMAAVKGADTKPELVIRRMIHSMGYRYRLHVKSLPGTPDIVFPSRRKVIFVHGCFWHQHACKRGARMPKSRVSYWRPKLEGNKRRDGKQGRRLRRLGWRILVIWECQIHPVTFDKLTARIIRFLDEEDD